MPNIVIQASAGSGKTMQLSNNFLKILFKEIDVNKSFDVDTIVASTFTRKAAGEITDRILNRLANALSGNVSEFNNLRNLMPEEVKAKSKNQDYINKRLFNSLAKLVRNLYKVRICTLDSFFSRIASTFFLELGFPSGWSIISENDFEKIINTAIHNVLENSEKNNARKIMLAIQQGDQDINVTKKLRELSHELLPLVRNSSPQAWDNSELLSKELEPNEITAAIDLLQYAELPQSKNGKTDSNFEKTRRSLLQYISKNDWMKFLHNTMVQKVITNENKYYSKPIEDNLLLSLRKFIVHAKAVELNKIVGITIAMRELFDLIADDYNKLITRNQVMQFDDITNRIGNLFKSYTADSSEFKYLFKSILHRTNSKINHLLLDEFQDTSKSQWNILAPFVDYVTKSDSTSDNTSDNTFLCVGDAKQAIYGWRGGVAEIFNEINSVTSNIERTDLMKSYRSCQSVIDTVNQVFENIGTNAALEDFPKAAHSWQNLMKHHETARTELDGYCLLETAPNNIYDNIELEISDETNEKSIDNGDDVIPVGYASYVVDRIIEINENHPNCSIGILVTKNTEIAGLMNEFRRRNVSVSEEGGSTITDSAAVQCVLSAMKLADHPDDGAARFHLVNSPLSDEIGLHKHDDDWLAANAALNLRRKIMEEGYGKVIERFVEILAPSCNQREYQRLEKLLELAYQFQEDAVGVRTKQFIAMINSTKIGNPSVTDNIRIMTIHKSKGMQFDIVVLPDLNGNLSKSNKTPPFIAGRPNATADIELVIKYLDKDTKALLPEQPDKYRRAFSDYIDGNVKESLSVLYVAMTRAIHELVMIIKPKKQSISAKESAKSKKESVKLPATFAGVLQAGLQLTGNTNHADNIENSDSTILYESGNVNWYKQQTKEFEITKSILDSNEVDADTEKIIIGNILSSRKKYRLLQRITPSTYKSEDSKETTEQETDLITVDKIIDTDHIGIDHISGSVDGRFKFNREIAMLWGKMIHACFENWLKRETWLNDTEIDQDFLHEIIDEVIRKEGCVGVKKKELNIDVNTVIRSFVEACAKSEIRAALSRPRYKSTDVEVQHERRFIVLNKKDKKADLIRGSIDRLVVERNSGEVINIEIIDFKTDRKGNDISEEDFLKNRKLTHIDQMKAYRKAIEQLYNIDQNKINVTLIFTNIGKVISAF
jgi:ATP-dependent exoDNAse (exonuclease V) beta subunit